MNSTQIQKKTSSHFLNAMKKDNIRKIFLFPYRFKSFWIIFCLGLIVSFSIFLSMHFHQIEKKDITFENQSKKLISKIQSSLDVENFGLYSLEAFFRSSDYISRIEFAQFTHYMLQESNTNYHALSWNPRILQHERQSFESLARKNGYENYTIKSRDEGGNVVAQSEAHQYVPVYYIEPYELNKKALGFNIYSDPTRRAAIEEAVDSTKIVATAPITLVQENGNQAGSLFLKAIYDGDHIPESVQERRELFKGLVVIVLRIGNVVDKALSDYQDQLDLKIYDVTEHNIVQNFPTKLDVEQVERSHLDLSQIISVGMRQWQIIISPKGELAKKTPSLTSWLILSLCLILTFALSFYVFFSIIQEDFIQKEVENKTKALKENEELLNTMLHDLKDKNAELKRFAFVASHDLQEPLRKLQQYCVFLEQDCKEKLSNDEIYFLEVITNAASRMRKLIKDLLTYSKESNRDISNQKLDFELIINDVLDELDVRIIESEAIIHLPKQWPHLCGDNIAISLLFRNLITNALKYQEEGNQPVLNITTSIQENGNAQIIFEDNGIGIDEDKYQEIFAPFKRLHNNRKYSGSGIGLALCRSVCDRHGWNIKVESELNKESRFILTIPAIQQCSVCDYQEHCMAA